MEPEAITDADRLGYEGANLTLTDGRKLKLHFGFGGLRRLEKRVGGFNAMWTKMQGGPEHFDTILGALWCGLWKTAPDMTEEQLELLLDETKQEDYQFLLLDVMLPVFPPEVQEEIRIVLAERKTVTTKSPGPTSSISPLSSVGSAPATSGS